MRSKSLNDLQSIEQENNSVLYRYQHSRNPSSRTAANSMYTTHTPPPQLKTPYTTALSTASQAIVLTACPFHNNAVKKSFVAKPFLIIAQLAATNPPETAALFCISASLNFSSPVCGRKSSRRSASTRYENPGWLLSVGVARSIALRMMVGSRDDASGARLGRVSCCFLLLDPRTSGAERWS